MIAYVLALGVFTLLVLVLGLVSFGLILMNWRHRRLTGTTDWTDRWAKIQYAFREPISLEMYGDFTPQSLNKWLNPSTV